MGWVGGPGRDSVGCSAVAQTLCPPYARSFRWTLLAGDRLERDAIPFFGASRLAAIEPRDVKRYSTQLAARGLAPASVAKAVAPVRALFATAVEEGLLRSNPAVGLRIARRSEDDPNAGEQVKALTEDELFALLEEVPEAWRLLFRFLFETGLRIGEAIELRWRTSTSAGAGSLSTASTTAAASGRRRAASVGASA